MRGKLLAIAILVLGLIIWTRIPRNETEIEPGETIRIEPGRVVSPGKTKTPEKTNRRDRRGPLRRVFPERRDTYVPPEGRVEITRNPDGSVGYRVFDSGFTFRPGIQYLLPYGLGLDVKIYFYKRFGLFAGGAWEFRKNSLDSIAGVSYHLGTTRIPNLQVVGGYRMFSRMPYIGLRLDF